VLFSNPAIVSYINHNFEPTWQSVSALPYYDYGESVQKIAAGNVATFICDADGKVQTLLPALYTAEDYLPALEQARLLTRFLARGEPEDRRPFLTWYHKTLAKNIKNAPRFVEEANGRIALQNTYGAPLPRALAQPDMKSSTLAKVEAPPEPTVDWRKSLRTSSTQQHHWNRQHEMFLVPVHKYLSELAGTVHPDEIARHVFKNILQVSFLDNLCLGGTHSSDAVKQPVPSKSTAHSVTLVSGAK